MVRLIAPFVIFLTVLGCGNTDIPSAPACLQQKLIEILHEDIRNPPAELWQFQYKGETVYYFPSYCCDFPSELYNQNCELLCNPDGGFSGSGDGQCPDFFEKRSDARLIWRDPRAGCAEVLIDKDAYDNDESSTFDIQSARIDDHCLVIKFGASGCSGISWETQLVDAGEIMESYPPQRRLRLLLDNPEACAAYFVREMSYDLTTLRIEGTGKIHFHLEGYDQPLTYSY